jgi:hypothetical protein
MQHAEYRAVRGVSWHRRALPADLGRQDAANTQRFAQKYDTLSALMDERMRQQWRPPKPVPMFGGGVHAVSTATAISPHTIRKGLVESHE